MSFDLKCGGRIVWAKHVAFLDVLDVCYGPKR